MAYVDRTPNANRPVIIAAVAALHVAAGYAIVNGLMVDFIKEQITVLEGRNIPLEPAPPPPRAHETKTPRNTETIDVPRQPLDVPRQGDIVVEMPLSGPPSIPRFDPIPLSEPQPQPTFAVREARPKGNTGQWVGTDDYPARDLREGNEGVTRFLLQVEADGRLGSCLVTQSSGHPGLDDAVCRNLMRRARFEPARDSSGLRVAGSYSGAVRWQIPRN